MDIWEVLGIEATEDVPTIKRAYALKLKIHHPEDDPDGFQILNDAYKSALRYSEFLKKRPDLTEQSNWAADTLNTYKPDNPNSNNSIDFPVFNKEESREDALKVHNVIYPLDNYVFDDAGDKAPMFHLKNLDGVPTDQNIDWNRLNRELLEQMGKIYADFPRRIDIDNWTALLNQNVMWDMGNRKRLDPMILNFLSKHYYLPKSIWKLIDQSLNIQLREMELYRTQNKSFVEHAIKVLRQEFPFNYNYIELKEGLDYDRYFEVKEKIYDAISKKRLNEAANYLAKANEFNIEDPDLLRMKGIILFEAGDKNAALEMFDKAVSKNPNDCEALFYRAAYCYGLDRVSDEIRDLKKVTEAYPDNYLSHYYLAKAYMRNGNRDKAKDEILKAKELNPNDSEIKSTMEWIGIKTMRKREPREIVLTIFRVILIVFLIVIGLIFAVKTGYGVFIFILVFFLIKVINSAFKIDDV